MRIPSAITARIPAVVYVFKAIPIICKDRGRNNPVNAGALNMLQYSAAEWVGSLYHKVLMAFNPSSKMYQEASFSVAESVTIHHLLPMFAAQT